MRRKKFLWIVAVVVLVLAFVGAGCWWCVMSPNYEMEGEVTLYVRPQHSAADVERMLDEQCKPRQRMGWRLLNMFMTFKPRTGAYVITPKTSTLTTFRILQNGRQRPIRWTMPPARRLPKLAAAISKSLMLDSATVMALLTDSVRLAPYGYTPASVYSLFVPNTYELYWDISLDKFMKRMCEEHDKFWASRLALAEKLELTPNEVATLASIVDEETAYNEEKSRIAGLYLNRLKKGMLLQADPTVKFSVGDETLRRILSEHLKCDNPYNTYIHKGLPPGPIRVASVQGIDAVLHAEEHTYLYMCAREDFSGTHNFATTFAEHKQNARRYIQALNRRGIRK